MWAPLVMIAMSALTAGMIRLQEGACASTTSPQVSAAAPLASSPSSPLSAVASRPSPVSGGAAPPARRGTAVYHRHWSAVLCSMGPLPAGGLYVSLSAADYGRASLCGSYLEITGPEGTVRAQVVDRCPTCVPGRLDLSERAFARIGDRSEGVIPVRYRLVRDPRPAPRLAVRVKPDSTRDWLALLVLGHGNPIRRVELRAAGRPWRPLRRGLDNHWVISKPGESPYRVRVTDRFGNRAVLARVEFEPAAVQYSRIRLYGTFRRPADSAPPAAPLPAPGPATLPTPFKISPLCS
ncbi:expansin EXLX1 family cellulose-binding protein [Spirillospora sp. NPDC048911]|uniref:expansin EXLX1 family cellulose-binding protein n=1 Tax=Spirillospora sp. NPDC048911 TaxID=3364527 RepID=UPI00371F61B2